MSFFKNLQAELETATGKGIVGLIKVVGAILWSVCVWLFDWQHKGKEPELKTNSFRMAAWSIILSLIFMPGLVTCSKNENQAHSAQQGDNQDSNKTLVVVQLSEGEEPVIPPHEDFRVSPYSNARYYITAKNKKYFKYSEASKLGETPAVIVNESSCFIIPAGRELKIYTAYRPLVAINMETTLLRQLKDESTPYLSRFLLFMRELLSGESLITIRKHSWKQTFDSWENSFTLQGNMTLILVKAKSKKDIPGDMPGGLVCF